jgi:hypothetical protein
VAGGSGTRVGCGSAHLIRKGTKNSGVGGPTPARPIRRLFLDDDPCRAEAFLAEYPDAVWVSTVEECIARLEAPWDEVHLDHDLGGEQFVDVDRDDCGMAVVRWLALEPRSHLRTTRFTVHSHNGVAAYVMVLQMKCLGLQAVARPFGEGGWRPPPPPPPPLWRRWLDRLRRRKAEPPGTESGRIG